MLTFIKPPTGLCVQYNVLPPHIRNQILDEIIASEAHFQPATVSTNVQSARRARVLYDVPKITSSSHLRGLVDELVPAVHKAFGRLDPHPATQEVQITAHGHGDYFQTHNDNGTPDSANREISFVYYVHTGKFMGGELLIHDMSEDGAMGVPLFDLRAMDNSLVIFTSSTFHSVRPVFLRVNNWQDHRFTINGWIRR